MNTTICCAALLAFTLAGCSTVAGPVIASDTGNKSVVAIPKGDISKTAVVPDAGGTQSILACPSKRIEYTPIPALPAGGYTDIEIDTAANRSRAVLKPWPDTPQGVNALLTNIATNITQSEAAASGGFGGIFSASHSKKQYVIDFMKWRAEPLTTTDNTTLGWVRVGAGLRLIVEITKDDGSASGSLLALAVNAKAGKVEGSISTELIGMDAKEVTQAMPFTVDLSEGNIQKVVEALAIVKTKLYDPSATVHPNLIARIECAPLEEKKVTK